MLPFAAPPILMSTPSSNAPFQPSPLSDAEYQRIAGEVLSRIESTLDRWLQDDVIDIDAQRTGGLLELSLPGGSKIIINTQPPLHELWLAAKGGGYHYKWDGQCWRDTRDGSEFLAALSTHASAQAGKPLRF
jgi:CyaY protein